MLFVVVLFVVEMISKAVFWTVFVDKAVQCSCWAGFLLHFPIGLLDRELPSATQRRTEHEHSFKVVSSVYCKKGYRRLGTSGLSMNLSCVTLEFAIRTSRS